MKHLIKKANLLTEDALPYIQKFRGKTFVVKYGGNAMKSQELKIAVMKDIALLKSVGINIVVVHGGGPNITEEMKQMGIEPVFINGLRVTDEKTMNAIEKIFKEINKEIKTMLADFNIDSGEIKGCIISKQKNAELGMVGEITNIDMKKIMRLVNNNEVPIISPIGKDSAGKKYNINADTAATKIAMALNAEKLTILTDIDGVIINDKFVSHLSIADAHKYITEGVITKGMIPKVEACVEAVEAGVKKAHLINGTVSHALLLEIFTEEGIGTEIVKNGC